MSARTLRHVLDGSDGILWNVDFGVEGTEQHWRPLFFNIEAAQRLLRLEAKNPGDYAALWEESKFPVDREVVRQRYFQAIRDREAIFSVQYRSRDRHNGVHWLRDHVRVQKTAERQWRFLIVTTDVTHERRASDVVSRTLRVLTHTLDSIQLVLWSADVVLGDETRWNLCLYNFPAAQKFIPLDAETPDAYVRAWSRALSPEERECHEARWREALERRESHYQRSVTLADQTGRTHVLREDVRIEYHEDDRAQVIVVSQYELDPILPTLIAEAAPEETIVGAASAPTDDLFSLAPCGIWHADLTREGRRLRGSVHLSDSGSGLLDDVPGAGSFGALWKNALTPRERLGLHKTLLDALEDNQSQVSLELRLKLKGGGCRYLCAEAAVARREDGGFRLVAVVTDVTETHRTLAELRASQERYQALVEHLPIGVYRTDASGAFLLANAALLRMLGYESFEALLERQPWDTEERAAFWACLILEERVLGREETWIDANCVPVSVRENAMAIRDEQTGELLGFEGTVENITERQKAFDLLKKQATLDPLTDLPNRSMAQLELEKLVSTASERHTKVGVLFVDVDKFKEINDLHGHGVGDRVLVQIARRLQRATRPSDTVARTGGDEFLILAPDILDADEAQRIATRVRRIVQEPALIDGHRFELDSSIGTVMFPQDGEDTETLLRHADIAMYHAKSQGGGVKSFTASMHEEMRERVTLEADLRRAVTAGELILHYQPQLDARSSRITGVEALVRWNHPERGLLPPSQFIPLAEETGLIIPLGEWVLNEACKQGALWRKAGIDIRMAVNVSPRQFAQRELPRIVAHALDTSGFPADRLDVELTESTLLEHERMVETSIAALRCLGVGLQIDDFGTGYSSLALLRRYRMEALKIDQGFIRSIQENSDDAAIVRFLVELAHTLGMVVIAEGVETEWHHDCLRNLGCDFVQGFHFSPPVQAEEIPSLITRFGGGL